MADVKIEFKLGGIEFSAEGGEGWIAAQLDKILEKAPSLVELSPPIQADSTGEPPPRTPRDASVPLAKFLHDHNASANQLVRFLAAAEWLTLRGNPRPSTGEVTKALRDNHQPRLGNPADCLNKNVSKGYCEKDGKGFFVTPEGRKSLG